MSKKDGHGASSIDELQNAVEALCEKQNTTKHRQNLAHVTKLFFCKTAKLKEGHYLLKKQYRALGQLQKENLEIKGQLESLKANCSYLNEIVNNISQALLFINFKGIITTYNAAAEKIIGKSSSAVLDKTFWEVFQDQSFGFSMKEALHKKQIFNACAALLHGQRAKQSPIEIEVDTAYTLTGMILLIRPMSDMARLKAIAAHNDRMKELGEMAAMVAHEIRNPLGGIKGFASLLQRDLADQPHLKLLATYIVEGTDSLDKLVNNVLNYSRPLKLHYENTDLVKLMQELILHLNADESIDPRIELHCKADAEELIINVDPQALKSALLNLCANAIKAMPQGGELSLKAKKDKIATTIKVCDTGEGISAENLKKIFVPFFTTRAQGHGLGLNEVRKIIEAHGGEIEVTSAIGKGTTFTIRLPHNLKG